jgi:hypothetical protein
LETKS